MITLRESEVPLGHIIPTLTRGGRRRLRRRFRRERIGLVKIRILMILRLDDGDSSGDIERSGICVRSTVSRVGARFCELGELGLEDGRQYNGRHRITEDTIRVLADLVESSPQDYGWSRPTWTRELLALQLEEQTGVRLSRPALGRLLHKLGARWGRPNMFVVCPWNRQRRARRLAQIRRLVRDMPADELVFYEDEVDIHLNPKSGPDWMLKRQQKRVRTPGQNEKRFVAGALNPKSGEVVWVAHEDKTSDLFIALLWELYRRFHGTCKRVHLVLDGYSIHSSGRTQQALAACDGWLALHFLPPYSPNHNKIERLWKELHANVTRNHRCDNITALMAEVDHFLRQAQPYPGAKPSLRRAA
jgi:transposase